MNALRSVAGMVCLLAAASAGCNTGDRPPGKVYFGPGSTGATSAGVTSATAPKQDKLQIVAFHAEAAVGFSRMPAQESVILVDPGGATDLRLLVDSGGGYLASGAPIQQGANQPTYFVTPLAAAGTKYQVLGRKGGARVSSNEVTVGGHQLNAMTISEPQGDYTGFPNLIAPPDKARWDAVNQTQTRVPEYLVILRGPNVGYEWVATIGTNQYKWGEAFAKTWFGGGQTPLPSGQHYLTVCLLDANGWATRSSERRASQTIVPYTFEVQ